MWMHVTEDHAMPYPSIVTAIFFVLNIFSFQFWAKLSDFLAAGTFFHIFWLVNLFLWAGVEFSICFVSFFNAKYKLTPSNVGRILNAHITKLKLCFSYNKSFKEYIMTVWI